VSWGVWAAEEGIGEVDIELHVVWVKGKKACEAQDGWRRRRQGQCEWPQGERGVTEK